MEVVNFCFLVVLFYSCLYNLLKTKEDWLKNALNSLPGNSTELERISFSFKRSLQGIYVSNLEKFVYHSLTTWIVLDFAAVRYTYLLCFSAGLVSLFPVVSPYVVLIPADLILFLTDSQFIKIFVMNLTYAMLLMKVDNNIYNKNVEADPYLTGLSVVFGIYAFGVKGMIYGPMLLCVSMFVQKVIASLLFESVKPIEKGKILLNKKKKYKGD